MTRNMTPSAMEPLFVKADIRAADQRRGKGNGVNLRRWLRPLEAHDIAAEHLRAGERRGILRSQRLPGIDGLHVRGDRGQRLAETDAVRVAV